MGYPEKYMHQPEEYQKKGKHGIPLTARIQQDLMEKKYENS
jgi:hypothetical protein